MTSSIGLNYPMRRTNHGGYFDKTFQDIDQIKANLVNLLSTRRGERIMNPEFGTLLYRILYREQNQSNISAIEQEIRDSVSRFMPYVTINNLNVDATSNKSIMVDIAFTASELPGQQGNVSLSIGTEN